MPAQRLRLYCVPSSTSSWAHRGKVFDDDNLSAYSMQLVMSFPLSQVAASHKISPVGLTGLPSSLLISHCIGRDRVPGFNPISNPNAHVAMGQILLSAPMSPPVRQVLGEGECNLLLWKNGWTLRWREFWIARATEMHQGCHCI